MRWYLYILDCDDRYYTGITTDPERRLEEHRSRSTRGAKFTRAARRHELVYSVALGDRGTALRAEARLKKMRRNEKLGIVRHAPDRDALLAMLGVQLREEAV